METNSLRIVLKEMFGVVRLLGESIHFLNHLSNLGLQGRQSLSSQGEGRQHPGVS